MSDFLLSATRARAFAAGVLTLVLAAGLTACGGGSGGGGSNASVPATPPGSATGGSDALAASTSLNIAITGASISSPPVVTFTVTNQDGTGMAGLTATDLRFNIAKLVPGSNGGPSVWQNYINRVSSGAVQGTQERSTTGYAFGKLVGFGNGTYSYAFATDITSATANPCPAPCTDASGKKLDLSYQPGLTHRVAIQLANSAYPRASGSFDFVPAGGAVTSREVVANATCNTCHNELVVHGTRVDTKLCVTCHNPGSWVAGSPATTVDFRAMIHRIHYNNAGAALPSVVAGTPYKIGNADFSSVVFPQDARNCTRCHTGSAGGLATATAQGDNWKRQPSIEACGSCHDNVYFGTTPDPAKPYQKKLHTGGVQTDNSACVLCHQEGRYTDGKDITIAHNFPARWSAASAKFKYNIVSVTPTTAGAKPVITFSVTDPTNGDKAYDLKTAAAFAQVADGTSRLAISIGWTTTDFANAGSTSAFGQPVSINILGNTAVTAGSAAGTYTVTSPVAIPAGQTGTLRVTIDGHPAGDVTTAGKFSDRLTVKSVFKDVAVSGTATARRVVVDIAKCNVCHGTLSLHGNNRTDEPGVCTVCHNPNATDGGRRPFNASTGALTGGVDGKLEESIDFKTMVHAIHAGQKSNGGFREKGIVVYGFGGSVNDFSKVGFPGKLNDCSTCHAGDSYRITGAWETPVASGILGTTISSGASSTDPADNLRITPTAAVCSSCHDSAAAKLHMQDSFNAANFSVTQAAMAAGTPEACAFCHAAGKALDVKTVHGVK